MIIMSSDAMVTVVLDLEKKVWEIGSELCGAFAG